MYGAVAKSLYDPDDPYGIHVNSDGTMSIYDDLDTFLERYISDERDVVHLGKASKESWVSVHTYITEWLVKWELFVCVYFSLRFLPKTYISKGR